MLQSPSAPNCAAQHHQAVKAQPVLGAGDVDIPQQQEHLSLTSASHANTSSTTATSINSGQQKHDDLALITTVQEHTQLVPHTAKSETSSMIAVAQAPGPTITQQPYQTFQSSEQDTFDLTHTVAPLLPPPGPGASLDDKVDFLQQQLDSFGLDMPIFDDLLSLGSSPTERRQGGGHIFSFRTFHAALAE